MAVLNIRKEYLILGGVVLLFALGTSFKDRILNKLASFIPSVEGFQPTPYWDRTRYSWGYGTQAPGPDGYITREQAFSDMVSHLLADYATLSNKITRPLTVNQWVAYLSFSYNVGIGNALNLVTNINSGNDQALGIQWNKYVYSGGQVDPVLVQRREKEFTLWNS